MKSILFHYSLLHCLRIHYFLLQLLSLCSAPFSLGYIIAPHRYHHHHQATRQAQRMTLHNSNNMNHDEENDSPPRQQQQEFFRLGYVTDVEGNIEYFEKFVERSNVLDFVGGSRGSSKNPELSLRDGCCFVYGGDLVDKGAGDIRLCRALVALKKRHPDRVFLLVGNRDLNKLRYTAELSPADMRRSIDEIPPPHWDPKAPTLREYLEQRLANEKCSANNAEAANTRVERLRYMLLHTLGCPDTFEFRRQELAVLRSDDNKNSDDQTSASVAISDEEVLESFLHEIEQTDGSLHQYLQHADVAARIGNSLFVHGAVDRDTMKFVPQQNSRFENPSQKPPPGKICENLDDWVDSMNDYLRKGLEDYRNRPYWDEARQTRGGESLMALQNRPAMWGRSVISNCYGDGGVITTASAADHRNDPQRLLRAKSDPLVFEKVSSDPFDPGVASWLLRHGVRRVVVGHKPTGDCPAVLSASHTGVEIVSADTSYSDTGSKNNRGEAFAVVEIVGKNERDNRLELSGTLKSGEPYHCRFNRLHNDDDSSRPHNNDDYQAAANGSATIDESVGDKYLGKKLRDGEWWVKASTSRCYHLCRGNGRKVEYKSVPKSDVSELCLETTGGKKSTVG